MPETKNTLPHWDLSNVYPGLESAEFEAAFEEAVGALKGLKTLFDTHAVMLREEPLPIDEATIILFERALERFNAVGRTLNTLYAYLMAFVTTDSHNTLAQSRLSELRQHRARFTQLRTRFVAWLGSLEVEALIKASDLAQTHAFALRKAAVQAAHLMSPDEEALAAQLQLTGGSAWNQLFNNFTSQITTEVEVAGERQTLPITAVRNLAYEPDRDLRRRAYEAELAAWEHAAVPIAAALNSVKGEMLTLSERRGWDSPLDVALFNNNIDRETLDTLLETTRAYFPHLRRYMKAKARALGIPVLTWYDLFAPLNVGGRTWEFQESRDFVIENFGTYSTQLADLARRAFEERWIDAEPREGKRGGAFCMWVRDGESRILANFQPAFGGMGTLAHELGHAFHNLMRAERTFVQRQTPMTLAETASLFCETLTQEAALAEAGPREQLAILEASLQDAIQVTVDIMSRFIFETEVFERRKQKELSIEEFKEIMIEAQRATYGDGLDPEILHPYMWAVKPHYYGSTFYNFPYLFGQLFSLGLYTRYRAEAEGFRAGFEDLLSATGMASPADLAARFDIDLHEPEFWRASLDIIRDQVDRFEALVDTQM